jgi:hypothetical protein
MRMTYGTIGPSASLYMFPTIVILGIGMNGG